MNSSYSKAKNHHGQESLRKHYANRAKGSSIQIPRFIEHEYTMLEHYKPHLLGLGSLAAAAAVAALIYNRYNKNAFDNIYLASY